MQKQKIKINYGPIKNKTPNPKCRKNLKDVDRYVICYIYK